VEEINDPTWNKDDFEYNLDGWIKLTEKNRSPYNFDLRAMITKKNPVKKNQTSSTLINNNDGGAKEAKNDIDIIRYTTDQLFALRPKKEEIIKDGNFMKHLDIQHEKIFISPKELDARLSLSSTSSSSSASASKAFKENHSYNSNEFRSNNHSDRFFNKENKKPHPSIIETVWKKNDEEFRKVIHTITGILNKMTLKTQEVLCNQICDIDITSCQMLEKIITVMYNKVIDEPNFGEMYASLVKMLEEKLDQKKDRKWKITRVGENKDTGKFFWTNDVLMDEEFLGPFENEEHCLQAVYGEIDDLSNKKKASIDTKAKIIKVLIENGIYIKILRDRNDFFVVSSLVENLLKDQPNDESRIIIEYGEEYGGFENEEAALENSKKSVSFKMLIIQRCREAFYKKDIFEGIDEELETFMKENPEATAMEKREAIQRANDTRAKRKRDMLGNICFIGELYKVHILKYMVVHECILQLLGHEMIDNNSTPQPITGQERNLEDENTLEALCRFLTTVGRKMEEEKKSIKKPIAKHRHGKKFDFYMNLLKEYSNDKVRFPKSRMRFMMKDVIDLKEKDGWVKKR